MPAMILRLLTLLALLAMPFGMGAALAAPTHHGPTAQGAEQCGHHDGQPVQKSTQHSADCTISCSMTIAAEIRVDDPVEAVRLPVARPLAERRTGHNPDTATPPPKRS
jgi:hypothetical protein